MSKLVEALNKARREGQDLGLAEPSNERGPEVPVRPEPVPPTSAPRAKVELDVAMRPRAPEPTAASPPTERWKGVRGVVPDRPGHHRPPEEHMVSLVDRNSFAAERFRSLRHLVEQKKKEQGLRLVAVASAVAGEGRSLIATNLAGALAQNEEARVLLVDADLRKPSLHRYLGLEAPRRGLVDAVLDPQLQVEDVTVVREDYNLSVLPAGSKYASPYEVLSSERFTALLASVSMYYDYVVIDTPPLSACPDARLLENQVDGYLIVAAADKTPRKQLDEALAELAPEKILGIVFNGQREAAGHHRANGETERPVRWWNKWRL